ncbi:MAG: sigma-70 family RNA polymerase sigma factor [Patescibacteria group bacterium]
MDNELEVVAHAQLDPETFGRMYDTYYQPVFGFMYSRTGRSEVAKDLTSETFFQALKNLHRYKPREGASFKSWLFAIAVAQIGNYYRTRSRFLEVTTDEAPELIGRDDFRPDIAYRMGEDSAELEGQIELLRRMMGKLNQRQQDILTLRFFSHMSVSEIAGTLHMKEGTIKSHIHRALKKLQVLMLVEMEGEVRGVQTPLSKKYEPRTVQN